MNDQEGKKINFEDIDIKDLIRSKSKKIGDEETAEFNIYDKQSSDLSAKDKYEIAISLTENESKCTIEECQRAKSLFKFLEKTEDISKMIVKCDLLIAEKKYLKVVNFVDKQQYEDALEVLTTLKDYKDVNQLKTLCKAETLRKETLKKTKKISIIVGSLVILIMMISIIGYNTNQQNWSKHFTIYYNDDNLEITGVKNKYLNETTFIIPEEIKGHPVTSIGDYAFRGCNNLTEIKIPSTVTKMGSGIFRECSSLGRIIVDVNNPVYDSRENCNAIIETSTNQLIF